MDKRKYWIIRIFLVLFALSASVAISPCGITDDFLKAGKFSRDEIKLGIENVANRFGLGSIVKIF